jgi:hypothetical protein
MHESCSRRRVVRWFRRSILLSADCSARERSPAFGWGTGFQDVIVHSSLVLTNGMTLPESCVFFFFFGFESLSNPNSYALTPFRSAKHSTRTVAVPSAQGRTVSVQGPDSPRHGARRRCSLHRRGRSTCRDRTVRDLVRG